jgi:hypothetical protein
MQLKCIISSVDGNKYCVRDRTKVKDAVNLLAEVVNKMKRGNLRPTTPKVSEVKSLPKADK